MLTLNNVEPFFGKKTHSSSLILYKYKNKEKRKTGQSLGPHLNYDLTIGPKPGPRGVNNRGTLGPGPNSGL